MYPGFLWRARSHCPRATPWFVLLGALAAATLGCRRPAAPPAQSAPASQVAVTLNAGGSLTIKSATAEFEVLPSGYIQASLVSNGKLLSLDEPETGSSASGDYPVVGGKEVRDFTLDFGHATVSGAAGKIGSQGKRIEISAKSASHPTLEKMLVIEVYDDFPNFALTTVAYKNGGFVRGEAGSSRDPASPSECFPSCHGGLPFRALVLSRLELTSGGKMPS